jgi:hypothetical protein
MTTNIVFKSNNFSVENRGDDYRYVKSNKPIKKGELLLIEHCYVSETIEFLIKLVTSDSELFNNLFPRSKKWNEQFISEEELTEDIENLVKEKVLKNAFKVKNNKFSIALDSSNFNSSITPNAIATSKQFIIDEKYSVLILYIISIEEINIDEEITISYGSSYFGDERDKICVTNYDIITKESDNFIKKIMNQYLHTTKCLDIIVTHISLFDGLNILRYDRIILSKRFMEKLKKEATDENISRWIIEKKIYYGFKLLNISIRHM